MTTYYYDDLSNVKKMCQTFSLLFRQVVAAVILISMLSVRPSVCLSVLLSMYSPDDEVMIYSPLFPSLLVWASVCVQLQQHFRN